MSVGTASPPWGPWARGFWEGLEPEPMLTVTEWADRHRMLSPKASAEAGPWRTSRTPYLAEIMDCLSEGSGVWSVTMMAGAQIGKTEAGNCWLGYIIDMAPAPTMAVWPTQPMAQKVSRTRIDPLIQESPRLKAKVAPPRARDAANTVELKEFPGGILAMVGANSPTGLRSMPIKNLFLDEVDAYPGDVGGEGDPCELVEARARTFSRRKILRTSTPTLEGLSRIKRLWVEGDQRLYYVPCPACRTLQTLSDPRDSKVWQRLRWDPGHPDTARFACLECGELIEERHKGWMLSNGEWRPHNPEAEPGVRSYHLSTMYSPWFTWAEVARKWEQAKGHPERLKTFVNTILGETWKQAGEVPKWERLYNRREQYQIGTAPEGVVLLTAGADVQKDRIEVEVVGWGRDLESWSIDYLMLTGDTAEQEVWDQLEELLARKYPSEVGPDLEISCLAVDSGYNTNHVYNWTRGKEPRVIAVKGRDGQGRPVLDNGQLLDIKPGGSAKRIKARARGARVWPVGTFTIKQELYSWLRRDPPTNADDSGYPVGWCHFPQYGEEYFKQLCGEALFTTADKKGFPRAEWRKLRERNEALDCRVYARAAAARLGVDRWTDAQWDERSLGGAAGRAAHHEVTKDAAAREERQEQRRERREGWMSRWHGRRIR